MNEKPNQDTAMDCPCAMWARDYPSIAEHHRQCRFYDPERDAIKMLRELCIGIEAWAADKDGVHEELCDAYERANIACGNYAERLRHEKE